MNDKKQKNDEHPASADLKIDLDSPTNDDLLRHLEEGSDVFRNKAIKAAFTVVDRKDFVGDDYHFEAYEDYPLPTLSGQTISQPTTVAFMMELLDPRPGDIILDIGAGSGWTTALLGHMVGPEGKVIGLEIKPELVELGRKNIGNKKYKKLPIEIDPSRQRNRLLQRCAIQSHFGRSGLP